MAIAPADIDEGSVIRHRPGVGALGVDDRLVLVDEGAGRGHALNPTATLVWRCLDGEATLGSVIDDLAAVFGAPRDEISEGVVSLARNLGTLGMFDGVARGFEHVPIEIQYVDPDECEPADVVSATQPPELDLRYLAAPPNT